MVVARVAKQYLKESHFARYVSGLGHGAPLNRGASLKLNFPTEAPTKKQLSAIIRCLLRIGKPN